MSWNGVKKQSIKAEIENWCEEMGLKGYTINSKGEIDVEGSVNLAYKDFKELPYKFGKVNGYFDVSHNKNLISLKNCPNKVEDYFRCSYCKKLDSLEGCPKEVEQSFFCKECKRKFTGKEIRSYCKMGFNIYN